MITLGINLTKYRDSFQVRVGGKKQSVASLRAAPSRNIGTFQLVEIETLAELQELLYHDVPPYVSAQS